MSRICIASLARLSVADAGQVLDAYQRDGEQLAGRGLTPKDRAAGRRLLKRVGAVRDLLLTPEPTATAK